MIIIDDMISSGESMLDVAKQLKDRKAGRVFVCTTFGLFTDGLEKFDEYYEKGYNLQSCHHKPSLQTAGASDPSVL